MSFFDKIGVVGPARRNLEKKFENLDEDMVKMVTIIECITVHCHNIEFQDNATDIAGDVEKREKEEDS